MTERPRAYYPELCLADVLEDEEEAKAWLDEWHRNLIWTAEHRFGQKIWTARLADAAERLAKDE